MTIARVSLRPKNEAPRRTGQGPRGTTNYVSSNNPENSTTALRLQRLRPLGIIGLRAEMLAPLAWGEAA